MADHVDRVSLEIADEIGIQIVYGPSNDSGTLTVSPYI